MNRAAEHDDRHPAAVAWDALASAQEYLESARRCGDEIGYRHVYALVLRRIDQFREAFVKLGEEIEG